MILRTVSLASRMVRCLAVSGLSLAVLSSAVHAQDNYIMTRPSISMPALKTQKSIVLPLPPAVTGFDIQLQFNDTPTAAEALAFAEAEAVWESLIVGYLEGDINSQIVTIEVNLELIDGPGDANGNILGSAGPTLVKTNAAVTALSPQFLYTDEGTMTFDTFDTADLANAGALDDVILHEMGHVLGIGTLWSSTGAIASATGRQELYVDGSGDYTGTSGLAAYNHEFNQTGIAVPVELDGGGGTADSHWNEPLFGSSNTGITSSVTGQDFRFELMTGWLNSPTFISSLTLGSLQDIGYAMVPEPASAMLLVVGVSLMSTIRSRN